MKLLICFTLLASVLFNSDVNSQAVSKRLQQAWQNFQADSQLKNSISSLYVIDAKTGKVVFDKNSTIGLAGASTQKIITAATAYELLGKDFRYKTEFGYFGTTDRQHLKGSLYVKGSGDPSLASWRWQSTKEAAVINRIVAAIKTLGISDYNSIVIDVRGWNSETIPGGWIWEDIGNYYGAGSEVLNWRENQYDVVLKSGSATMTPATIVETIPKLYSLDFLSYVTAAAKGSGDNTIIYLPVGSSQAIIRGTIPVGESRFVISGAMPSARRQFVNTLMEALAAAGIRSIPSSDSTPLPDLDKYPGDYIKVVHRELSPSLDSLVYWFLKKSINLYGEALVKTFANQKQVDVTTENGIKLLKDYWKEKGIAPTELNMADGSGLSPLNRITTHAQVTILQYAKKQTWFPGFYDALPVYNDMKMKSGTINGVKGFCGYQRSKDGNDYIFSFLINNYNGSSSSVVEKMYKVLDALK
jgi:D-alanyl-D-alanine carboxypeptidase/D-alanyl-D-alanine-endopeptidase (penicillin-binding protein 4)